MNTRITLALGACLSLASFGASAQIEGDVEASEDGYIASGGNVIKTGLDECLRSGTFSSDNPINVCEGIEEVDTEAEAEAMAKAKAAEAEEEANKLAAQAAAAAAAQVKQGKIDTRQFSEKTLFDTASADLNGSGEAVMNSLFGALEEYKGITELSVTGHTDSRGSDDYNLALSEERAQTVASAISSRYPNTQINVQGMGESRPTASNDTAEGRQLNRRVDIEITATRMTFN